MSSVYSTQFIVGSMTGPTTPLSYTVPAGMVAILRDITLASTGIATWQCVAAVVSGPAVAWLALFTENPGQVATHQWQGRTVLNGGDELILQMLQGNSGTAIASGYLLAL